VGRIGRAHGLHGYVVVHPETDNPERFVAGSSLLVDGRRLTVAGVRTADTALLVRFEGIADRTVADALRGSVIAIPAGERRPLHAGEYWPDELVGLRVLDAAGTERGTVVGMIEGSAQDRLVVETPAGVFEVPFVSALVPEVDQEAGIVRLADIAGLLGDDDAGQRE
jgi:16S rRNA processing protein RimM